MNARNPEPGLITGPRTTDTGTMLPVRPSLPRPGIGSMVHYVSFGTPRGEYPSCCRAAIVTDVGAWVDMQTMETAPGMRTVRQRFEELALALTVENPNGTFKDLRILPGAGEPVTLPTSLCGGLYYPGGTWHWPGSGGAR